MEEKVVFAIGRWMPIHLGHKAFLTDFAKKYDKVILGIGSCYENGTPRNCIPAVKREKLIRKVLKIASIPENKIEILHIPDKVLFEDWLDDVLRICKKYNVTHFCTGNKEDILDVLKEKNINLKFEMINPEENTKFMYHSTDIRNAIIKDNIKDLEKMLPAEIISDVLNNTAIDIIKASKGEGKKINLGTQNVKINLMVKNKEDKNTYLLSKNDVILKNTLFGEIKEFESPAKAAVRILKEKLNIDVELIENIEEPAKVKIEVLSNKIENMNFDGLEDFICEESNSCIGGMQCFSILIEDDVNRIKSKLNTNNTKEEWSFVKI